MKSGDICEDCALFGVPGALCIKHAATDELIDALIERVNHSWLNMPVTYKETFRKSDPSHPVLLAEKLLRRIGRTIE